MNESFPYSHMVCCVVFILAFLVDVQCRVSVLFCPMPWATHPSVLEFCCLWNGDNKNSLFLRNTCNNTCQVFDALTGTEYSITNGICHSSWPSSLPGKIIKHSMERKQFSRQNDQLMHRQQGRKEPSVLEKQWEISSFTPRMFGPRERQKCLTSNSLDCSVSKREWLSAHFFE